MTTKIRLARRVVVLSLAVFGSAFALGSEALAPVDPSILDEFAVKGEATFWVLFREQADLSPAFEIRDWSERGWFVYRRLVGNAESSQSGVRVVLANWGAEATPYWIANMIEVRSNQIPLIAVLASLPEVEEIIAPPIVIPPVSSSRTDGPQIESVEWNIERIRAPEVWSTYGTRGEGIVVGSIDTGVQYDHPALVEQYRGNLGGGVFDHNYNWYDPALVCGDPSNVPCDSDVHGTSTTGIAVGDDGGTNQIGVAPGARFIMVATDWSNASLLSGMQWMLAPTDLNGENPRPDLRPHVVNNAWGFYNNPTVFQATVQAWIAAGVFPTFALGNDGPGCNTGASPGNYPETYAVGASDFDDDIPNFSSRGPSPFGPVKPDISAPGESIRSCVPPDSYEGGLWGSSFAAPHVTGTVALMWSFNPELIGNIYATRQHLDYSAVDISDLSCGGDPGNNNVYGEGLLDAFGAVSVLFYDSFESGDTTAWSAVGP